MRSAMIALLVRVILICPSPGLNREIHLLPLDGSASRVGATRVFRPFVSTSNRAAYDALPHPCANVATRCPWERRRKRDRRPQAFTIVGTVIMRFGAKGTVASMRITSLSSWSSAHPLSTRGVVGADPDTT